MPYPIALEELRYLTGTSWLAVDGYTAGNASGWDPGTSTKVRAVGRVRNGLTHVSEPDTSIRQDLHGRAANHTTIARGSIGWNMYAGAAESTTSANPVATIVSKIMGGIDSPANRTDTVEASSSTTSLNLTSHGLAEGQALLVGTKGDGGGDGTVVIVEDATTSANAVDIWPALPADPSGNAVVIGTTCYFDSAATMTYFQFLHLLTVEATTFMQCNAINCMGGFTLEGLGPGELPMLNFEFDKIGQWKFETNRETAFSTSAQSGNRPPIDKGLGSLVIVDSLATTRVAIKGGSLEINPDINILEVEDKNGMNGVGEYVYGPSVPTLAFTPYSDQDFPGLSADFLAGTAKGIVAQFGHAAERCFAVDMQNWTMDNEVTPAELSDLHAFRVTGHAEKGTAGTSALQTSPMRLHWF